MNAIKRYRIIQCSVIAVTLLAIGTEVGLGLYYGFGDLSSVLWVVIGAVLLAVLGVNVWLFVRFNISRVLMKRCDVTGYQELYMRVFGRSRRKSVAYDRAVQMFCIAFYSGEFESALGIYGEIEPRRTAVQPELNAYLAYCGYRCNRPSVAEFAQAQINECLNKEKRLSKFEEECRGVTKYVFAMQEQRYTDALAFLPPRKFSGGARYFYVFTRYCFARAQEARGNFGIAAEVDSEIDKIGCTLWFAQEARKNLTAMTARRAELEKIEPQQSGCAEKSARAGETTNLSSEKNTHFCSEKKLSGTTDDEDMRQCADDFEAAATENLKK